METVVQIAQLLLALSILVGIHEAGHMLTAKMFGMKVEKFFIGFPPTIFSFKKGETEYGLGAIPLGGFVKISGMVDESMDKEAMAKPPQPWEFRSKPAWQRLIVMLGGIFVNVVAGVIAMIILTYNVGDEFTPSKYTKEIGILPGEYGLEVGFEKGDKIVKINGEDYRRVEDIYSGKTLLTDGAYWTVDRNGSVVDIPIPNGFIETLENPDFQQRFFDIRREFEVTQLGEGMESLPFQPKDRIVKIGDQEVKYYDQYQSIVAANAGGSVPMVIKRGDSELDVNVDVRSDSTVGIVVSVYGIDGDSDEYSFGEAIPVGTAKAFNMVILNAKAIGKMFTGDISPRSMSGPIGIVNYFPKTWDWNAFWRTTAMISMILAFMNLLPIPALDGGHVVFLLFEMISGKAPSVKFLEAAQVVGMVILLLLMVFAFGNDILKLFGI
ncbi:RIP metalloprotease RseP [Roseivirga misakiensis]|uniref:Zinc metalloprotease n=1 Tax=Roseivirga misakiensis TaxID=1563681 RepID=A0A1E5T569_9BACT|nr:RIP metalloprotease RseP [Roseivirga misakiensis]OEK06515.1 RIP metalloprotease RseP [Roseivirga misakiensis]